jgi:hypothetical protein
MKTIKDYTTNFKVANCDYGTITVPAGTRVTHRTAMGIDKNYHFVDEFDWIEPYSDRTPRHGLIIDMRNYGLNVPKEYVSYPENILKMNWDNNTPLSISEGIVTVQGHKTILDHRLKLAMVKDNRKGYTKMLVTEYDGELFEEVCRATKDIASVVPNYANNWTWTLVETFEPLLEFNPPTDVTDVVFRKFKNGNKEIIALFHNQKYSNRTYCSLIESYQHVGQHGSADYYHVVANSTPATIEEYSDLYLELVEKVGYNLKVYKRRPAKK